MPDTATQLALDIQIPVPPAADPRLPINQRLIEATRPDMIQVAPGRWAPRPGRKAPDVTLATWQANADGTYTPTPICERMVKLTRKLTTMLGFPGQFETIRRLGRAGYVECIKLTPHIYMLNLDSWFGHLRRCAEDPDFWDQDGKNLRAYKQAQGWIDRDTRKESSGSKRKHGHGTPCPKKGRS
jgi:hypothetical protein